MSTKEKPLLPSDIKNELEKLYVNSEELRQTFLDYRELLNERELKIFQLYFGTFKYYNIRIEKTLVSLVKDLNDETYNPHL